MPDPRFYRSTDFYDVLATYYGRYPWGRYRDGKYKINTKIFLGLHVKNSPAVEEVEAVEPIEIQAQEAIESKFGRIVYSKASVKPIAPGVNETADTHRFTGLRADVHHSDLIASELYEGSFCLEIASLEHERSDRVLEAAGDGERDKRRALLDRPNELAAIFNDEQPPNRGDGKGRIEPKLSQSAIVQAAKNSPGVKRKTSTAHELLELFKSSAHIIPDSPTDEEVTESAIGQTEVDQLSDQNPILTGCTLSAEFLARYSPPQPEIIHFQSDADGQLSLLDFEVESTDEPPDPDDFETLDEFREAMARWDAENAEALTISMDSMCEWAPCPDDWYEPESPNSPLKASSMGESSSTCEFLIPVFDAWCDRANRQTDSDEPPDTGIFARLPKPKPPSFPPMNVAAGDRANNIRKFARSASCLSGRSPPSGGDFM
ncbi:hypothetical protein QUA06_28495 [Microcoleus sp. POL8_C6]